MAVPHRMGRRCPTGRVRRNPCSVECTSAWENLPNSAPTGQSDKRSGVLHWSRTEFHQRHHRTDVILQLFRLLAWKCITSSAKSAIRRAIISWQELQFQLLTTEIRLQENEFPLRKIQSSLRATEFTLLIIEFLLRFTENPLWKIEFLLLENHFFL